MSRIIREDDVIALIDSVISLWGEHAAEGKADIQDQIDRNVDKLDEVAINKIRENETKISAARAIKLQLALVPVYKNPKPRPLHELLAEDENVGNIPNPMRGHINDPI